MFEVARFESVWSGLLRVLLPGSFLPVLWTVFGIVLAFLLPGAANADTTTAHVCEHSGLVRLISVEYQRPDSVLPCRVVYEKTNEGVIEYPWQARNEPGFCEARVQELVLKLRNAGWQCRVEEYKDD